MCVCSEVGGAGLFLSQRGGHMKEEGREESQMDSQETRSSSWLRH